MARKVRQIRRKGKQVGIASVPATAVPDFDTRMALIQALIPVALERVHEELKNEVIWLAGERYAREGRQPGARAVEPPAWVDLSRRSEDSD